MASSQLPPSPCLPCRPLRLALLHTHDIPLFSCRPSLLPFHLGRGKIDHRLARVRGNENPQTRSHEQRTGTKEGSPVSLPSPSTAACEGNRRRQDAEHPIADLDPDVYGKPHRHGHVGKKAKVSRRNERARSSPAARAILNERPPRPITAKKRGAGREAIDLVRRGRRERSGPSGGNGHHARDGRLGRRSSLKHYLRPSTFILFLGFIPTPQPFRSSLVMYSSSTHPSFPPPPAALSALSAPSPPTPKCPTQAPPPPPPRQRAGGGIREDEAKVHDDRGDDGTKHVRGEQEVEQEYKPFRPLRHSAFHIMILPAHPTTSTTLSAHVDAAAVIRYPFPAESALSAPTYAPSSSFSKPTPESISSVSSPAFTTAAMLETEEMMSMRTGTGNREEDEWERGGCHGARITTWGYFVLIFILDDKPIPIPAPSSTIPKSRPSTAVYPANASIPSSYIRDLTFMEPRRRKAGSESEDDGARSRRQRRRWRANGTCGAETAGASALQGRGRGRRWVVIGEAEGEVKRGVKLFRHRLRSERQTRVAKKGRVEAALQVIGYKSSRGRLGGDTYLPFPSLDSGVARIDTWAMRDPMRPRYSIGERPKRSGKI
ncbi:hypothetical protein R3P38DRAFT_2816195 [Favolaschia claudopus]|uniref:Uncharacterized protein n=1 Tax=Favolaschia claudopus TaxID=2862362 RepID=A0AAV9YZK6_9AGAR